jgi:uncharacterized membrane protein YczE
MKKHFIYIPLYLLGFLITGLGVVMLIRSNFGAGPWDTTVYNLSALINISLGQASALINGSIVVFVTLVNKKTRYIFVVIPIAGIALSLDFWDLLVLPDFNPVTILGRSLTFLSGVFIITFGLGLVYITRYPAMVFEEFTFALMKLFKTTNFFITRIFIETLAIVLAIIFGFLAGIGFGQVNIGSIVLALTIGPIIALQIKWLSRVRALFETAKVKEE